MKHVGLRLVLQCVASGAFLVACGEAGVGGDDAQSTDEGPATGGAVDPGTSGASGGAGPELGVGGSVNAASGGGAAAGGSTDPGVGGSVNAGTGGAAAAGGSADPGAGGTSDPGVGGSPGSGGSSGSGGGVAVDCVVPTPPTKPVGYGEKATGGGNATPVVVSSFAAAEAALTAYRTAFKAGTQNALVLRFTGTFNYGSITDV
ncbi:MAG: hypothetical protein RL033_5984, partial [Pseudomonadota bacterium]